MPKNPPPEAPGEPDPNPENRKFVEVMTSHPFASTPPGNSPVVKTVKSKVNRVYSRPQRAVVINPGHPVGPAEVTVSGTA